MRSCETGGGGKGILKCQQNEKGLLLSFHMLVQFIPIHKTLHSLNNVIACKNEVIYRKANCRMTTFLKRKERMMERRKERGISLLVDSFAIVGSKPPSFISVHIHQRCCDIVVFGEELLFEENFLFPSIES